MPGDGDAAWDRDQGGMMMMMVVVVVMMEQATLGSPVGSLGGMAEKKLFSGRYYYCYYYHSPSMGASLDAWMKNKAKKPSLMGEARPNVILKI